MSAVNMSLCPCICSSRWSTAPLSSCYHYLVLQPRSPSPVRRRLSAFFHAASAARGSGVGGMRDQQGQEDEEFGLELRVEEGEQGTERKKNRRVVQARVGVQAAMEAVWAALTDYERLPEFVPGLAICKVLQRGPGEFARLHQVGQQELALGLKFSAKGVIDCYEMAEELLPCGGRRREIHFNMVEGDFQIFQGKWSVLQTTDEPTLHGDAPPYADSGFQTVLSYEVELEPKLWVPVMLIQGIIFREIKSNILAVREEAERIQRLWSHDMLSSS